MHERLRLRTEWFVPAPRPLLVGDVLIEARKVSCRDLVIALQRTSA